MQNTSARNNSIKMEVIHFASLYWAKEVLIFYVNFFYRRTFYLCDTAEVVFPFFHTKNASAAKNLEVYADAFRGHSAPRGWILRYRGCIHLTATSSSRFNTFFLQIALLQGWIPLPVVDLLSLFYRIEVH